MLAKTTNYEILLRFTLVMAILLKCDARISLLPHGIITVKVVPHETKTAQVEVAKEDKSDSAGKVGEDLNMITYDKQRDEMIETENLLLTGGHLKLNDKELKVHQTFMQHKLMEINHGMEHQEEYAPGLHFFKAKSLIDQSKVFKFLQAMPKGANLHVHRTPSVSSDWMIKNLTYMPGLLKCFTPQGNIVFSFRVDPEEHGCRPKYYSVATERKFALSKTLYDKHLEKKIFLNTLHPKLEDMTSAKIWNSFENIFSTFSDTMTYEPAFRSFQWQLMTEMYEDNIMYAEVRMKFKSLYGPNGIIVATQYEAVELSMKLIDDFKRTHPGFLGLKIIYAQARGSSVAKIKATMETFKDLHARYPNFIIGFDLIGQEDKGNSLHTFWPVLQNLPPTAKYFFHAGETNWHGSSADLNLIDAILMNTTRLGHGYSLMKHPILTKAIKERDIALEISPISNQVLDLVWDLRNHPAGYFMADNIPIVITNDDPGFWKAKALSYDYYYAIMSLAPNNAGLKTLKSLVWNSIKYSAMSDAEKVVAYQQLENDWNVFLDRVISGEVV